MNILAHLELSLIFRRYLYCVQQEPIVNNEQKLKRAHKNKMLFWFNLFFRRSPHFACKLCQLNKYKYRSCKNSILALFVIFSLYSLVQNEEREMDSIYRIVLEICFWFICRESMNMMFIYGIVYMSITQDVTCYMSHEWL